MSSLYSHFSLYKTVISWLLHQPRSNISGSRGDIHIGPGYRFRIRKGILASGYLEVLRGKISSRLARSFGLVGSCSVCRSAAGEGPLTGSFLPPAAIGVSRRASEFL